MIAVTEDEQSVAGGPNSTFEGEYSVSEVWCSCEFAIQNYWICTINKYHFPTNDLQNPNLKAVEGLNTSDERANYFMTFVQIGWFSSMFLLPGLVTFR